VAKRTQAEMDDERIQRLSGPVPPWRDVEAITKRVADEIEELRSEVDRLAWTTNTGLPHTGASEDLRAVYALAMAEVRRGWPATTEAAAVEAALRGDANPLANYLLRPVPGMGFVPDEVNPAIEKLSLETWTLIADLLTGARNLKTGKRKGERGPRRRSKEERRKINPVHDAADHVPAVATILARLYPDKGRSELNKRAIEIAARLKRADAKVLKWHLNRGRYLE
jgi:hypothetical protein